MFQFGNLGLDYHGHLLFYAGPRRWAWVYWTGGVHTVFGLRLIPPSWVIPDPYFLRLVTGGETVDGMDS